MRHPVLDEITESVDARIEIGDVPDRIHNAALKRLTSYPTMMRWIAARRRELGLPSGNDSKSWNDLMELARSDELLNYRLGNGYDEYRQYLKEELGREECERRTREGLLIQVIEGNGESTYVPVDEQNRLVLGEALEAAKWHSDWTVDGYKLICRVRADDDTVEKLVAAYRNRQP